MSALKSLVVGCPSTVTVSITEQISDYSPITMMMPNLGWSTDDVWTFPLPTGSPTYCEVINTEIIDITEDGVSSSAVFFEGNGVLPCT